MGYYIEVMVMIIIAILVAVSQFINNTEVVKPITGGNPVNVGDGYQLFYDGRIYSITKGGIRHKTYTDIINYDADINVLRIINRINNNRVTFDVSEITNTGLMLIYRDTVIVAGDNIARILYKDIVDNLSLPDLNQRKFYISSQLYKNRNYKNYYKILAQGYIKKNKGGKEVTYNARHPNIPKDKNTIFLRNLFKQFKISENRRLERYGKVPDYNIDTLEITIDTERFTRANYLDVFLSDKARGLMVDKAYLNYEYLTAREIYIMDTTKTPDLDIYFLPDNLQKEVEYKKLFTDKLSPDQSLYLNEIPIDKLDHKQVLATYLMLGKEFELFSCYADRYRNHIPQDSHRNNPTIYNKLLSLMKEESKTLVKELVPPLITVREFIMHITSGFFITNIFEGNSDYIREYIKTTDLYTALSDKNRIKIKGEGYAVSPFTYYLTKCKDDVEAEKMRKRSIKSIEPPKEYSNINREILNYVMSDDISVLDELDFTKITSYDRNTIYNGKDNKYIEALFDYRAKNTNMYLNLIAGKNVEATKQELFDKIMDSESDDASKAILKEIGGALNLVGNYTKCIFSENSYSVFTKAYYKSYKKDRLLGLLKLDKEATAYITKDMRDDENYRQYADRQGCLFGRLSMTIGYDKDSDLSGKRVDIVDYTAQCKRVFKDMIEEMSGNEIFYSLDRVFLNGYINPVYTINGDFDKNDREFIISKTKQKKFLYLRKNIYTEYVFNFNEKPSYAITKRRMVMPYIEGSTDILDIYRKFFANLLKDDKMLDIGFWQEGPAVFTDPMYIELHYHRSKISISIDTYKHIAYVYNILINKRLYEIGALFPIDTIGDNILERLSEECRKIIETRKLVPVRHGEDIYTEYARNYSNMYITHTPTIVAKRVYYTITKTPNSPLSDDLITRLNGEIKDKKNRVVAFYKDLWYVTRDSKPNNSVRLYNEMRELQNYLNRFIHSDDRVIPKIVYSDPLKISYGCDALDNRVNILQRQIAVIPGGVECADLDLDRIAIVNIDITRENYEKIRKLYSHAIIHMTSGFYIDRTAYPMLIGYHMIYKKVAGVRALLNNRGERVIIANQSANIAFDYKGNRLFLPDYIVNNYKAEDEYHANALQAIDRSGNNYIVYGKSGHLVVNPILQKYARPDLLYNVVDVGADKYNIREIAITSGSKVKLHLDSAVYNTYPELLTDLGYTIDGENIIIPDNLLHRGYKSVPPETYCIILPNMTAATPKQLPLLCALLTIYPEKYPNVYLSPHYNHILPTKHIPYRIGTTTIKIDDKDVIVDNYVAGYFGKKIVTDKLVKSSEMYHYSKKKAVAPAIKYDDIDSPVIYTNGITKVNMMEYEIVRNLLSTRGVAFNEKLLGYPILEVDPAALIGPIDILPLYKIKLYYKDDYINAHYILFNLLDDLKVIDRKCPDGLDIKTIGDVIHNCKTVFIKETEAELLDAKKKKEDINKKRRRLLKDVNIARAKLYKNFAIKGANNIHKELYDRNLLWNISDSNDKVKIKQLIASNIFKNIGPDTLEYISYHLPISSAMIVNEELYNRYKDNETLIKESQEVESIRKKHMRAKKDNLVDYIKNISDDKERAVMMFIINCYGENALEHLEELGKYFPLYAAKIYKHNISMYKIKYKDDDIEAVEKAIGKPLTQLKHFTDYADKYAVDLRSLTDDQLREKLDEFSKQTVPVDTSIDYDKLFRDKNLLSKTIKCKEFAKLLRNDVKTLMKIYGIRKNDPDFKKYLDSNKDLVNILESKFEDAGSSYSVYIPPPVYKEEAQVSVKDQISAKLNDAVMYRSDLMDALINVFCKKLGIVLLDKSTIEIVKKELENFASKNSIPKMPSTGNWKRDFLHRYVNYILNGGTHVISWEDIRTVG